MGNTRTETPPSPPRRPHGRPSRPRLGRAFGAVFMAASTMAASVPSPGRAEGARAGVGQVSEAPDASEATALAERLASSAFAAYERKDYLTAVSLYLAAQDAAPSGAILFNIARIYDVRIGDRGQAEAFYRRYLADPSAYPAGVGLATQRLAALLGSAPTGTRLGSESEPGAGLAGGDGRAFDPAGSSTAGGRPRGRWSTERATGFGLAAAGVVSLCVGVGFGIAAIEAANTVNALCTGNDCSSQRGVDAARAGTRDAAISTIGFVAGGTLTLVGAVLFLLGGEAQPTTAGHPEVRLEPDVAHSGLSLRVLGSW